MDIKIFKVRGIHKSGGDFSSLFRAIIICILATLTLFTSLVFAVLRPILLEQTIRHSEQILSNIDVELSDMCASAKKTATYTLLANTCIPLLNATTSDALSADVISGGLRQMRLLVSNSSKIDSISIVNRRADHVFSTQAYPILSGLDSDHVPADLLWLDKTGVGTFSRRTIRIEVNHIVLSLPHEVYSYAMANTYDNGQVQSAVIVDLSLEYLQKQISDVFDLSNAYLQILDQSGVIVRFDMNNFFSDEKTGEIFQNLHQSDVQFVEKTVAGEKYVFLYYPSEVQGVSFQVAYKSDAIYGPLRRVERIIALLFILVILASAVFSFFTSKRVHGKYQEREEVWKKQAETSSGNAVFAQQKFWQDFLGGCILLTKEQLQTRLRNLHMEHIEQGALMLMAVDLHNLPEQFTVADAERGMNDRFREAFGELSPVFLFSSHGNLLYLLCPDTDITLPDVQTCTAKLGQSADLQFNLLGECTRIDIASLPASWKIISSALPQAFFYQSNTFLQPQQILKEHSGKADKSNVALLERITFVLSDVNLSAAYSLFEQYEFSLRRKSYDNYFNCILQMLMMIDNMLQRKSTSLLLAEESGLRFESVFQDVRNCTKVSSLTAFVKRYFSDIAQFLSTAESKRSVNSKIDQVYDYIQNHFSNSQLSTADIADEVGVSVDYLRKIFKTATGQTVSEYISSVRLRAAAERIRNSDAPLGDISACCGFSSVNYFYTCFKKHYGVTPRVYKELQGKLPSRADASR